GAVVTQNIRNLLIEQTGDGIGVQMHQTWDPAGKFGPSVADTVFLNSSPTTTTAVCLSVSGVWSVKIEGNFFSGKGAGGGPIDGIGGFGVLFELDEDVSSSSMNVIIAENTFVAVSKGIFVPNREELTGGRVEGLRIVGNNMVAGQFGIRTSQVLALSISSNQISDYYIGVASIADFDVSILGNTEITGANSGIAIIAKDDGITERYSIVGNNVGSSDACIRLTNTISAGVLRSITITANTLRGMESSAKGLAAEGAYGVSGICFCANVLWSLAYGVWTGPSADITSVGNQYYSVAQKTFGGLIQGVRSFSESRTVILAGGGATETVNISVPAGYFDGAPDSAYLTSNDGLITGYYNWDGSSGTNLQFIVRRADGATITSVERRFSIAAFDSGY
ncbi:hypothetical protein, partial [Azotobacter vinelandii]|uniref:hypothetical protein n=1 Tax=Azotobacter vinelandii TaxID=354 RepID=UPI000918F3EE